MEEKEFYSELKGIIVKTDISYDEYNNYIDISTNKSCLKMYDGYIRCGGFDNAFVDLPYSAVKQISYAVKSGIVLFLENGGYIVTRIYAKNIYLKEKWMIDDTHIHLMDMS